MGVGQIQNLFGSPVADKFFQDIAAFGLDVLAPGGELSVGKGSRPALAEAVVAVFRKNALGFQLFNIRRPAVLSPPPQPPSITITTTNT